MYAIKVVYNLTKFVYYK